MLGGGAGRANGIPNGGATAAFLRWVILRRLPAVGAAPAVLQERGRGFLLLHGRRNKTPAAARTSTGHRIQVSLLLAEPPAASCVCFQLPGGVAAQYAWVAAAHGDSVLIQVGLQGHVPDDFVYSSGAAAADPPSLSLSLLPPYYYRIEDPRFPGPVRRHLATHSTGLS